jgi:hypothetical protein
MPDETSTRADLARRLSNARALLNAGMQKSGLGELWFAEALARGNAESLAAVLEVAAGFEGHLPDRTPRRAEQRRREADLATLIGVLRDDLAAVNRLPAEGWFGLGLGDERSTRKGGGFLAAAFGGALLGALIGGVIGGALYVPEPGFFDLGPGPLITAGLIIGFLVGAIVGPTALWVLRNWLARRQLRTR